MYSFPFLDSLCFFSFFDLFSYDYHEFKFLSVQLLNALISMKGVRRQLSSHSLHPSLLIITSEISYFFMRLPTLLEGAQHHLPAHQYELLKWAA